MTFEKWLDIIYFWMVCLLVIIFALGISFFTVRNGGADLKTDCYVKENEKS